jgi:hypothetical protein
MVRESNCGKMISFMAKRHAFVEPGKTNTTQLLIKPAVARD